MPISPQTLLCLVIAGYNQPPHKVLLSKIFFPPRMTNITLGLLRDELTEPFLTDPLQFNLMYLVGVALICVGNFAFYWRPVLTLEDLR